MIPLACLGIISATTAFSPSVLFGAGEAGGWYDTTEITSLFQDAGTTPVTSTGDPIGRIADLGPNGDDLNQTTVADKPAYKTFPRPHTDPLAGDFMTSVSVLTGACTVAILYPSGDVHFRLGTDVGDGYRTDDDFIALVAIDRALTSQEKSDLLVWFADKATTLDTVYDFYIDPISGDNSNTGTSASNAYADFTNLTSASANTTIGISRGTELIDKFYNFPDSGFTVGPYGSIVYAETQVQSEPLIIAQPDKPRVIGASLESGPWTVVTGTEFNTPTSLTAPAGNVPMYHEASDGTITRLASGTAGALALGEFAFSGGNLAVNVGALPDRAWRPTRSASFTSDGVDDNTVMGVRCQFNGNDGLQNKGGSLRFQADSVDCEWNSNDGINFQTVATISMIRNCTLKQNGRETDFLGDGFSGHVASSGTIRNTNVRWAGKDCISNSEQGDWVVEGCLLLNGGQGYVAFPEAGVAGSHTVRRTIIAGTNGNTVGALYKVFARVGNAATTFTLDNVTIFKGVDANTNSRGVSTLLLTLDALNLIVSGSFQFSIYEQSGTLNSDFSDVFGAGLAYLNASEGADSVQVDPLFEDASNGDFRLTSSSPVDNAGTTVAGVTDQFAGTAPSMGAIEAV